VLCVHSRVVCVARTSAGRSFGWKCPTTVDIVPFALDMRRREHALLFFAL